MKVAVKICDLCLGEGLLKFASCSYQGESDRYHACKKHQKQVEGFGMDTSAFEHSGDLDLSDPEEL